MQDYIILDYDGTLHDTMHIYKRAFLETYAWLVQEGRAEEQELADAQISPAGLAITAESWGSLYAGTGRTFKLRASASDRREHGKADCRRQSRAVSGSP